MPDDNFARLPWFVRFTCSVTVWSRLIDTTLLSLLNAALANVAAVLPLLAEVVSLHKWVDYSILCFAK